VYNFTAIEKKWQQYWEIEQDFRALEPEEAGDIPKSICAGHVPLPQRRGASRRARRELHRHRHHRAHAAHEGINVLHPTGWDAFGLPAEQYAIKTNRHPREDARRQHR